MSKKAFWKLLLAGSLLLPTACKDAPHPTPQEQEEDLSWDIEYVSYWEPIQVGTGIRYPAKYKDWDRFDENGHNISYKEKIEKELIDSLNTDSLSIDSLNTDSLSLDSISSSQEHHKDSLDQQFKDSLDNEEKSIPLREDSLIADEKRLRHHKTLDEIAYDTRNAVFITIDDGPWAYTYEIAKALYDRGHKATFFLIWNNIKEQYYPVMQAASAMWHEFWNHSNSHANFRKISYPAAVAELRKTEEKIEQSWVSPAPYFRFPYGNTSSDKNTLTNFWETIDMRKFFGQ